MNSAPSISIHFHVDEYQDTNPVAVRSATPAHRPSPEYCVVGDEINPSTAGAAPTSPSYSAFRPDFPSAKVIRLERKHRSTQSILDAAGAAVVKNNPDRLAKLCAPDPCTNASGRYFRARDAQAEAEFVAEELQKLFDDDSINLRRRVPHQFPVARV